MTALIRRIVAPLPLVAMLMAYPSAAAAMPSPPSASDPAARTGVAAPAPEVVVEHLRLRVPAAARSAWIQAERETWEPWLQARPGFLGRELLWDPQAEEGILLIRWASRQVWKAIPQAEIDAVQRRFEERAAAALGRGGGGGGGIPFELLHSGELQALHSTPAAGGGR